ncbi:MAG: alpha/beta hydrolase [Pseudomonadota bacterium]
MITPLDEGHRYSFDDGVFGLIPSAQALVECGEGVVRVRGSEVWPQIELQQTDTVFESKGIQLAGRLIEPINANPQTPLVIYAHGSEPWGWIGTARDPYQMVGRGISVFVYDKRGTGRSEGTYNQNFPLLADDMVAAAAEAKRLAQGRFGRFGLFGLSQGGWIAPLAAERAAAEFIGIGYGLVVDITEEDAAQVELELREAGYGDEVIAKARRITDATGLIARSGYTEGLDELDQLREAYGGEVWFSQIRGGFSGVILGISTDELRANGIPQFDHLNIDWSLNPANVLSQVQVPQLWVLAADDREAPVEKTLQRLKILREQGRKIEIRLFPGTDHGMVEFNQAADGSREYTRVTAGFYDLMADWAKGQMSGRYGQAELQ